MCIEKKKKTIEKDIWRPERREKENWIFLPNSISSYHQPFQKQIEPPDLPMTAWKEYGYWARPVIDGVEVRNNACKMLFLA
jgi:hypothetical protein